MKIAIHAVGRMKAGPEKDLAARYLDRFAKAGPAVGLEFSGLTEIPESQAARGPDRIREEADRLAGASLGDAVLVLLDERGRNLTSQAFAENLASWRDQGKRTSVFAIGGPDGHDPRLRDKAGLVWSFGALTWPHQLVRVMLAEQLYRAATILSGHPYHRA
ncbi:23S rRNA (pseudouridine(1915)-N(3))-methyltransferase RlmH [Pseudaminobacter sp. 19-2017]|uniref:Ribosomal RNA large subunit methyltransferase H n=1 Tax=Pseudaminobacter soli (ex Zhang et al. 2022) TaxID=2831468 RepID=A0A942E7G7_9HYPH|nr:23S rRNA (pseudouridine(1915)-N(3))-methyltransferase RlmH [Pseudaminobacter soli]MBS3649842.1 23S rRNA (pseudouridine(1915)-N(3))-methyltransferase RlmH [Pseudaminobacter soli]